MPAFTMLILWTIVAQVGGQYCAFLQKRFVFPSARGTLNLVLLSNELLVSNHLSLSNRCKFRLQTLKRPRLWVRILKTDLFLRCTIFLPSFLLFPLSSFSSFSMFCFFCLQVWKEQGYTQPPQWDCVAMSPCLLFIHLLLDQF